MDFTTIPVRPVFEVCLSLRDAGLPQKRQYQAMYYVRPDMLICIDDLSCLKNDGPTDFEDIFKALIFKPRLEDLVEYATPFLHEVIKMGNGTFFAYSNIQENEEFLLKTGRKDAAVRAAGRTIWEAIANLCIDVKGREQNRALDPAVLDKSENRFEHTGAETPPAINPNKP